MSATVTPDTGRLADRRPLRPSRALPAVARACSGSPAAQATAATPWLYRTGLRWTPLLWATGALYLWSLVMLVVLALRRWPRGVAVNVVIASWMSIALAQAASALLNGILLGDIATGLQNALSLRVVGWAVAALGIAVGAAWNLGGRPTAHWVAHLGLYTLVFGLLGLAAAALEMGNTIEGGLRLPTPVGAILPERETVDSYASMTFFRREDTLGEQGVRLVLFYPWAPALGTGSLAVALISLRAADRRWRWVGVAGGLLGLLFSWSRLAIAIGLLVALMLVFLRLPHWLKAACLVVGAAGLVLLLVADVDPVWLLRQLRAAADQARSGSSMARVLIYEMSWKGFLEAPLIGHGWSGESVHRVENLPIGSHSTLYGLLYTGGIVTLACFLVALATTFLAIVARLADARTTEARRDATIALCLWVLLALSSPYEALYSLTLPCLVIFTWIGGAAFGAQPGPVSPAPRPQRFDVADSRGTFLRPRRTVPPLRRIQDP